VLSRVAESLFWLGRNVERAETVARILDVNLSRAVDLHSQRDGRAEALWRSVMRCAGFLDPDEIALGGAAVNDALAHCGFGADNASSIDSSVRVARSNALSIRSELPTEVWELINVLYLYVDSQNLQGVLREGPSRFLRRVRDTMQAFAGVSDGTMTHGDGWNFLRVGRHLERAYMTARMLEAIDAEHEPWRESQRLLDMCCAAGPFAQHSRHVPEPRDALGFIIFSQDFPRSLRFCTREVDASMHRISRSPEGTYASPAERRLGRLRALFDYTPLEEALADGVAAFAHNVVRELEYLSADIEDAYFPRLPVVAADGVMATA
jgi:uncharacterized alpha-E superfamily protein